MRKPFGYADYEADPRLRNPQIIAGIQAPYVEHLKGCRKVLDLACGSGIFLELLKQAGIPAVGVERNEPVVADAQSRGLEVICADVFDYLAAGGERFDGVYCSHVIEHLTFDRLLLLIELIADRLEDNGRLVLVFPNPESIRMQLLGFWKDPEHVRFYHADLVESVCGHYGLPVERTNKGEAPNSIGPLRLDPPCFDEHGPEGCDATDPDTTAGRLGVFERIVRRLGFVTRRDLGQLRRELKIDIAAGRERAERFVESLATQVEAYNRRAQGAADAFNRIWSRPDEIVMVCRKREGANAR